MPRSTRFRVSRIFLGTLLLGSANGAVKVAGVDLSAKGDVLLSGQSVAVSGVIDSVSFDEVMRTKKSGLLSKKVTTTTTALDQERWWPRRSAATG